VAKRMDFKWSKQNSKQYKQYKSEWGGEMNNIVARGAYSRMRA